MDFGYADRLTPAWDDERVEQLRTLAAAGLLAEQIAESLGNTTKSAVIGQCHRRKIALKNGKGARKNGERKESRNRLTREIFPFPPIEPDSIDIPIRQRKALHDLKPRHCRWPVGDPGTDGFFFCGGKVETGRSYCFQHCCVAYRSEKSSAAERSP